MLIRAKAPLRISFAGGGTDVVPFPQEEGGAVLNATITKFAHATLRSRDDRQIKIESLDLDEIGEYEIDGPLEFDGKLDLIKAAIKRLGPEDAGYSLFLQSSAPPGSGLGSSSTMMVALVGLLVAARNQALTEYEVADLAHSIERNDLGVGGGSQDHYSAAFGGFNFIEFEGDRVIVNPLRVSPDTIYELEHNLLLCYTGTTRRSDRIIADQTARFEAGEEATRNALLRQKELAIEMKNALLQRRIADFGDLLGQAWEAKKQMSPHITNDAIDELYDTARSHGAQGGKITGAGGGGYLMLYCEHERRHHVAEAVTKLGAAVTDLSFYPDGVRTWRVGDGA